ncbi:MAG: hypothetical protein SGJ09_06155 [Phycisphaerae bacterium]|nr:hypothetical protein [Phycisphaerae bacterium]
MNPDGGAEVVIWSSFYVVSAQGSVVRGLDNTSISVSGGSANMVQDMLDLISGGVGGRDVDSDSVLDLCDNRPNTLNPEQSDFDATASTTVSMVATNTRVRAIRAGFEAAAGPRLYAAGSFGAAGSVNASNVAAWNGTIWKALGTETNNAINTLSFWRSGRNGLPALYAGGAFTSAGGTSAARVAQWEMECPPALLGAAADSSPADTIDVWLVRELVDVDPLPAIDIAPFDLPPDLDLNYDGRIDAAGLGILISNWGKAGAGDFDQSGSGDKRDLALLLTAWQAK